MRIFLDDQTRQTTFAPSKNLQENQVGITLSCVTFESRININHLQLNIDRKFKTYNLQAHTNEKNANEIMILLEITWSLFNKMITS